MTNTVKLWAEPVNESDLIIGNSFFTVSFVNNNGKEIPVMETLLLRNIDSIDCEEKVYCFYELGLWDLHLKIEIKPQDKLYRLTKSQMNNLYTFDEAMRVLLSFNAENSN